MLLKHPDFFNRKILFEGNGRKGSHRSLQSMPSLQGPAILIPQVPVKAQQPRTKSDDSGITDTESV